MGLYVVSPTTRKTETVLERTPSITVVSDGARAEIPESLSPLTDDFTQDFDLMIKRRFDRADGRLVWLRGESLLSGSAAGVRGALTTPGRRSFVPVHRPFLDDLDLITLEPRLAASGRPHDYVHSNLRISGTMSPSRAYARAVNSGKDLWAKHTAAVLLAGSDLDGAIDQMASLWRADAWEPLHSPLILRNLIVLLIKAERIDQAEHLLRAGTTSLPGYAELAYLAAALDLHRGYAERAVQWIDQLKNVDSGYLGSLGAESYRLHQLIGELAAQVGNQTLALERLMPGVTADPPYEPSVRSLLQMKLGEDVARKIGLSLTRSARKLPHLRGEIVEFLLRHNMKDVCQNFLDSLALEADEHETLLHRVDGRLEARPTDEPLTSRPGVVLCGPLFVFSSLARINREIAQTLCTDADLSTCLVPYAPQQRGAREFAQGDVLTERLLQPLKSTDLTIRHHWPPAFDKPAQGKLAVILPWEFSSLPKRWADQINANVDALWVPSRFVADVATASGIDESKVHVIRNGVDLDVFQPRGNKFRPRSARGCTFLYAGGLIKRKGVDVLLKAYARAFEPGEDVSLVILDMNSHGHYASELKTDVLEACRNPRMAHVMIQSERLTDEQLASMYRGADALVHPYRGEGFGMPMLEAMACATPVITIEDGPAREFCNDETAYLTSATTKTVVDTPLNAFTDEPMTWFEPNVDEIALSMRRVYEDADQARRKGKRAAACVASHFGWKTIRETYRENVKALIDESGESVS